VKNTIKSSHFGPLLDRVDNYSVIDCRVCGFRHLDPIPERKELQEFYDKKYFQSSKPDYLQEDQQEVEHRNIFFDQRLDFFHHHAPGHNLLDIGCGDGLFLQRAQKKGWKVLGVEPSEYASALAKERGINVIYGTLEEFSENNVDKFDVVHLKNVLEHVEDPIKVINDCRELLNANGILYLEVPNDYDISQRIGVWMLNEHKSWLCIPDHINYFTFSSLKKLVGRNKFLVLRSDTTFPMYLFLCLGFNFIQNKQLGKR